MLHLASTTMAFALIQMQRRSESEKSVRKGFRKQQDLVITAQKGPSKSRSRGLQISILVLHLQGLIDLLRTEIQMWLLASTTMRKRLVKTPSRSVSAKNVTIRLNCRRDQGHMSLQELKLLRSRRLQILTLASHRLDQARWL